MKRSFKYHTAWVGVLAARQQMAEPVADDIMTKLHSAFKDLQVGSTDDDLFDRLAAAINVGLLRAVQRAPARARLHREPDALLRALQHRQARNDAGRLARKAPERRRRAHAQSTDVPPCRAVPPLRPHRSTPGQIRGDRGAEGRCGAAGPSAKPGRDGWKFFRMEVGGNSASEDFTPHRVRTSGRPSTPPSGPRLEVREMRSLTLPLKREYFEAIRDGHKPEEFRLCNEYWTKRLPSPFGVYDRMVLTLGYPARDDNARRLVLPWRGYTIKTITHPHFGPAPVSVFAIDVRAAASIGSSGEREEQ